MTKMHISIVVILFCCNVLIAQTPPFLLDNSSKVVSIGLSANPHLNSNLEYLYSKEIHNSIIQRIGFFSQVNIPLFSQSGIDFDIRFGTNALFSFSENFKSIGGFSWNISKSEDLNGNYLHSGFKFDVFPGYYGENWVYTLYSSIQYQPWVHITHSELAKSTFKDLYPNNNGMYDNPKDGVFYQNNVTFQLGFGSIFKEDDWYINLTAGFQHQINKLGLIALPDIGILPFYGGVNFGYSIENLP